MTLMQNNKPIDIDSEIDVNLRLLHAGSNVVLELSTPTGQKRKIHSTFIGYVSQQYILIHYPDQKKLGHFADFIKPGALVTVKGLHEGLKFGIVAFTSQVKQVLLQPSKTIALEFPTKIQVLYLRSGIRLQTKIAANVNIAKIAYAAHITNLSPSGCQLIIERDGPETLSNDSEIEVTVLKSKEQDSFSVIANVCNFKKLPVGISCGVRFIDERLPEIKRLLYLCLFQED